MIGSTQRRIIKASRLAILLILSLLWPAANLPGQDKREKEGPALKQRMQPAQQEPGGQVLFPPAPTTQVQPLPPFTVSGPGGGLGQPMALFTSGSSSSASLPPPPRFTFTIDPKTPLKDLLPAPSKIKSAGAILTDDLTQVPEVEFGAPVAKNAEAMKNTAHAIAKINHLNAKKTDGFLEALREDRPDLHGLPIAMGDACRTKGERNRQFNAAVTTVRALLHPGVMAPSTSDAGASVTTVRALLQPGVNADVFWGQYQQNHAQCDAAIGKTDQALREHDNLARIGALMQILAPESASLRLGLVKYLSTLSHVEATRALAKLAIFSAEEEVRRAAADALKVRRERDYTDVLLQGLRYPLPAVAKHTSEALVTLERNDLVPQLVEMLDEPDPRLPVVKEVNKKKVPVVREMVRINHHRNCLLCHAPGNTDTVAPETLSVAVPTPDQPLNPPSGGYQQNGSPDLLVRIDVTYLRQDFSMMQAVADAAPWPEMQRFDFLVRTRELTEEEAAAFRSKLNQHEKGRITPYQRAAVTALRELTGKDTAPTAQAWRELLALQK
jgi:hypothetical protein